MNNFEYYFEIAAQDLGIALFFTALIPILVTLAIKSYNWGKELYASFRSPSISHIADLEKANPDAGVKSIDKHAPSHKSGWNFGHKHADA